MKNLIVVACILFGFISCSSQKRFGESAVVPAARGSVKVKRDKNENYKMAISVKHLAEPQRLSPSKKFYVVWLETKESGYKNVGQIVPSNSLSATLNAVTPFEPRRVFITGEDERNVQTPGSLVVLNTYLAR